MNLSQSAWYAVEGLVRIGSGRKGTWVPSDDVRDAGDSPSSFMSEVLGRLERVGILRPSSWAHGAYCLARPADTITLLEIVEAADGPFAAGVERGFGRKPSRVEQTLQALCPQGSQGGTEEAGHRLRHVRLSDLAGKGN
jgi:Rrf2 family protein